MCALRVRSDASTNPEIMTGPLADYFWCREEKAAFDVLAWRWEEGEEGWRQSPPVSGAKQHHGNGLMLARRWVTASVSATGEEGQGEREEWGRVPGSGQPDTADSRSGSYCFDCFPQGSCWHSHFGAPAKDSTAYLRTEQQSQKMIFAQEGFFFFPGLK